MSYPESERTWGQVGVDRKPPGLPAAASWGEGEVPGRSRGHHPEWWAKISILSGCSDQVSPQWWGLV